MPNNVANPILPSKPGVGNSQWKSKWGENQKVSSKPLNRCSPQREVAFQTWHPACKKQVCSGLHFVKNPRWGRLYFVAKTLQGDLPEVVTAFFVEPETNLGWGSPLADACLSALLSDAWALGVGCVCSSSSFECSTCRLLVEHLLCRKLFTPRSGHFLVFQKTSSLLGCRKCRRHVMNNLQELFLRFLQFHSINVINLKE